MKKTLMAVVAAGQMTLGMAGMVSAQADLPSLTPGWNLVGLMVTADQPPMDVTELGDVSSVWKWATVNGLKTWAVYLPSEGDQGAYAASKGFGVLDTIEPGEGFWVNVPAPPVTTTTSTTVTTSTTTTSESTTTTTLASSGLLSKLYYPNGNLKYEGIVVNDQPNGKGKRYYENGPLELDGEFIDGQATGIGKWYDQNYYDNSYTGVKWSYEGEFKNDHIDGKGKTYKNDVIRYDGDRKYYNDLNASYYEGIGKLYDDGVLSYDGGWQGSKRNGPGKLFTSAGEILYEGTFTLDNLTFGKKYGSVNGIKTLYEGEFTTVPGAYIYNGQGKYYLNDVLRYEGGFVDGIFTNSGKAYYANGTLGFEGNFLDGKLNGYGKQYDYTNGYLTFAGNFTNGKYDFGTIYDSQGTSYTYTFSDGKLESFETPPANYYDAYAKLLDTFGYAWQ